MAQRRRIPPETRFWAKVEKTEGCWVWLAGRNYRRSGYGIFGRGGRGGGSVGAHRFSWELHFGPIPAGMLVCHTCDNPPCVNPDHLFLGSHDDNSRDKISKGRNLIGGEHTLAVLSEGQVHEIRRLWQAGGLTQTEIAVQFNTTKGNISQIVRGKKWRHILPADWQPPAPRRWSRKP